jgi:formylmethanofuran dehydrogenase subunit E
MKKIAAFHGHICPGLAYGYRAADAALKHLGDRAVDEELVAVVENDSCAVDAVQVLTGCTFGKGNLIFRDYGKQVYTFFHRGSGKAVRISVEYRREEPPEERALWDRFQAGDRTVALVEQIKALKQRKVQAILSAPEEELLAVRPVDAAPPSKARIYPSARCDTCGEKAMAPRLEEKNGQRICIPCAQKT